MYTFRGFQRSTGIYNGINYDKLRFCFTSVKNSPDSSGELPVVVGGKLPSCKFSSLSSVFDGNIDTLSQLIGEPCEVLFDCFGTIVQLRFPVDND